MGEGEGTEESKVKLCVQLVKQERRRCRLTGVEELQGSCQETDFEHVKHEIPIGCLGRGTESIRVEFGAKDKVLEVNSKASHGAGRC